VHRIHYEILVARPESHFLDVALTVEGPLSESVEVVMPVWSPGSYLVREYARNLQDLLVTDPGNSPLPVVKVEKNRWRIDGAAAGFTFCYRLYANELSVQATHVDESHAFIHGPAVLPYVEGHIGNPCTVRLAVPDGWKIATGLEPGGTDNTFIADNYDQLADSPIECGDFAERSFTVRRRRHRLVVSGCDNFDLDQFARDVKRIVEHEVAFWGEAPYGHYTFICHVYPGASGGLEHRNSTVMAFDPHRFHPRKDYEDRVLGLVAHEFFHTWSVKRIRPKALGPFDYSRENYTRLLWVFEGITAYYDSLLVRRAGLMTPRRYLKVMADRIGVLARTPGRLHQPLAEASFDTWIKFYRPSEHTPNSAVSYYLKGELVAMLLDLKIRARTDGRHSLDDVMRELWARWKVGGAGIEEDEFERIAAGVTGVDLRRFFDRAVRSTDELDFGAALRPFGLRLDTRRKGESGDDPEGATPDVGIDTEARDGFAYIKTVYEGSAAAAAGLSPGDLLLAIDGLRVPAERLKSRLRAQAPGRRLCLTVFRRDRLTELELELTREYELEYLIRPVEKAPRRQVELREAWLGGKLESK
jgi:predicted metalloprotease with PDZ domain